MLPFGHAILREPGSLARTDTTHKTFRVPSLLSRGYVAWTTPLKITDIAVQCYDTNDSRDLNVWLKTTAAKVTSGICNAVLSRGPLATARPARLCFGYTEERHVAAWRQRYRTGVDDALFGSCPPT